MTRPNKLECLHLAKTFQSSLTFAGNTRRSLPKKEASDRHSNWVGSGFALKLYDLTGNSFQGKHSSLLCLVISDEGEKFYNIDTRKIIPAADIGSSWHSMSVLLVPFRSGSPPKIPAPGIPRETVLLPRDMIRWRHSQVFGWKVFRANSLPVPGNVLYYSATTETYRSTASGRQLSIEFFVSSESLSFFGWLHSL